MINDKVSGVRLLTVGPMDEHHAALAEILGGPMRAGWPGPRWTLASSANFAAALPIVTKGEIPIVIFDHDHDPAGWRQMLDLTQDLPTPPYVIVTSRLADDRLWSEALHLGAYDVLAKPFASAEVVRVLRIAWLRWQEQYGTGNRVNLREISTSACARASA